MIIVSKRVNALHGRTPFEPSGPSGLMDGAAMPAPFYNNDMNSYIEKDEEEGDSPNNPPNNSQGGDALEGDFDENYKNWKINDSLSKIRPIYIGLYSPKQDENPEEVIDRLKEKYENLSVRIDPTDNKTIIVEIDGLDRAVRLQRDLPGMPFVLKSKPKP